MMSLDVDELLVGPSAFKKDSQSESSFHQNPPQF